MSRDVMLAFERVTTAYNILSRCLERKTIRSDDSRYLRCIRLRSELLGLERRSSRLVSISINDTSDVASRILKWLGKSGSVRERLDIRKPRPRDGYNRVDRCLKVINQWKAESRRRSLLWRVEEEAEYSLAHDWYLIMDTLTLRRGSGMDPRDALSSKGWRNYKQRWREIVRVECGFDRKVRQQEYLWYFGCVQFGDAGGNPHLHVLWGCRRIPADWLVDPNVGLVVPKRREIDPAKTTWAYGWNTPVAVRTGFDDIWARHGWVWPVDSKTGQPLPVYGARGAANYVGRYIGRPEEGDWQCRTRMSRGLGLRQLSTWVQKQPTRKLKTLCQLSQVETWEIEWQSRTRLPCSLVRSIAWKERLARCLLRHPLMTLRVLARYRLRSTALMSKLHESLSEMPRGQQFSVCMEWLNGVIRKPWVAYDDRAERDLMELVEAWPRRKRDFHAGLIGRRNNADV